MALLAQFLLIAFASGIAASYEQRLQLQSCSQSSVYVTGGNCERAIDGNTNQIYSSGSCAHTDNQMAWWEAKTPYPAIITRVLIYNRQDCCSERLTKFVITVEGVTCATYNSTTSFSVMNFTCASPLNGRAIRISLLSANFLNFCELQAFGSYQINSSQKLAIASCSQSSVSYGGVCGRAIDNNTSQVWSDSSCSHTDFETGWWKATTVRRANIILVEIFNRLDCCSERLNNFSVSVDGAECASYSSLSSFSVMALFCNKTGQIIEIQNRLLNPLTLCEVRLYGQLIEDNTSNLGDKLGIASCLQSSVLFDGVCNRAIDNKTSQNYADGSCSHTQFEFGWWQGFLSQRALIAYVKINNRLDCCSSRLNNFFITVDGVECASYNSSSSFSVMTFACNRTGQVIQINNRLTTALTLCEIQLYGKQILDDTSNLGKRLAFASCSQSSVAFNGDCNKAIDNKTSQNYADGSCTLTQFEIGWWQVILKQRSLISSVTILNRLDCCSDRLNSFFITVDGVKCASYNSNGTSSMLKLPCDGTGQVIRINNRLTSPLSLCEVIVFGKPAVEIIIPKPNQPLQLSMCEQSSVSQNGVCTRAIDNNKNQIFDARSCALTQSEFGWWSANTDNAETWIHYIVIYNRLDCCSESLNNFLIRVDDVDCARFSSASPFSVMSFYCNRIGRNIKIVNRILTYMALCEVQAFGIPNAIKKIGQNLGCFVINDVFSDFQRVGTSEHDDAEPRRYGNKNYRRHQALRMTPQLCAERCWAHDSACTFIALQNGDECWCGFNFSHDKISADQSKCNVTCAGDVRQLCGGALHKRVYEISSPDYTKG